MGDTGKAVFLSYASQDAEAAKKICEALRAAGVEVWFDQNELVGGDAWDQKIRGQISSCALFVPVISANTQARLEGYFRREWKQAAARTHDMADEKAFLLPAVIDDTKDAVAKVPAEFKAVQWTRLPGGETPPAFCARVQKLLSGEQGASGTEPAARAHNPEPITYNRRLGRLWWALPIFGVTMALVLVMKEGRRDPAPVPASTAPASEARQLADRARALVYKEGAARTELEAAEELCKRAVALDPTEAEALAVWSEVNTWFIYHGFDTTPERRESARGRVAQALQLAPTSFEARFAQASYLGRSRGDLVDRTEADVKRSGEMLGTLLRERPDEPRALHLLGVVQSFQRNLDGARATLRRLAENPEFAATAWSELAWSEFFAPVADYRAAEAALDQARGLRPIWGSLILKTLLAVEWRGDLELALATQRSLPEDLKQEDLGVYMGSWVHLLRREPDEVLRVLEAAPRDWIHTNGYDGPKAVGLALAYQMRGDQARADVQWQIALRLIERRLAERPDTDSLLKLKAYVLAATGQKADAEATLRLVRDVLPAASWPRRCRVIYTKALLGDAEGAMDLLEHDPRLTAAVLRLDPQLDPLRKSPRFKSLLARLEADPARSPKAPAPSLPLALAADDKSVAVLAFANLSDDKANEYFSDGISEELLNVLAKVPGLKVTARTSSCFFKGPDVPIPEIAQKLGVAYVIEGSVRKQGDKVRITAQLIKAADGFHVWSDTFTRDLKDVFAVQDEIAGLIAQNLQLQLGAAPARPAVAMDPQAFELYVRARQAWSLRTEESFARAEQLLHDAIRLAPDFVRARAALVDVTQMRAFNRYTIGRFGQRQSPELERHLAEVREVLAVAPDLAEAYATMGLTLGAQWKHTEARAALRRAVELNPNYATARQWYGMQLAEEGRMDEALAELKLASELDPLSFIILDNYGWLLTLAGRYTDALQILDRALALNPGFVQTSRSKALVLAALGRPAEAQELARQVFRSDETLDPFLLAEVGLKSEAEARLGGTDLEQRKERYRAFLAVGRIDEALALLADPTGVHVNERMELIFRSAFDVVRQDPRFVKTLEILHLTEANARAQAWRAAHPPVPASTAPRP